MTNTVAANTPAPNTFAANTFAANTPAPKTTERIVPETTAAAAPAPVTDNWLSRNASDTSEAAAPLPLQSAEAPAPRERIAQAAPAERAPVTAAEQSPAPPATITADSANAAQTESMGMLPLLLGAAALLGLVGGAFFLVMGWMRRRSDVLTNLRDAERNPAEPAELLPLADDAPTFAPLPPIGHEAPQDDVDEALRRFAGNARRRRVA